MTPSTLPPSEPTATSDAAAPAAAAPKAARGRGGEAEVKTGRRPAQDGPERRCLVTRDSGPKAGLIRFVLDPQDRLVPDLAGRLPGRGFYVTADRAILATAVAKRAFNKAARRPVTVAPDLVDQVTALLARRLGETLALARRAGLVTAGFEKVRERLGRMPAPALLVQAADGAEDGRGRLARLAAHLGVPALSPLPAAALSHALGLDHAVHVVLEANALTARLIDDAARLAGLVPAAPAAGAPPPGPEDLDRVS